MLPYLAPWLTRLWGPFRLFESHLTLICLGASLCAVLTVFLLPKLWKFLPRDQGKPFVKNSEEAQGKPTGAGFIFVLFFLLALGLVLPPSWKLWGIAFCLLFCMLTGFLDDASEVGWGELKGFGMALLLCLQRPFSVRGRMPSSGCHCSKEVRPAAVFWFLFGCTFLVPRPYCG